MHIRYLKGCLLPAPIIFLVLLLTCLTLAFGTEKENQIKLDFLHVA